MHAAIRSTSTIYCDGLFVKADLIPIKETYTTNLLEELSPRSEPNGNQINWILTYLKIMKSKLIGWSTELM